MGICRNATVAPKFWPKPEFFGLLLLWLIALFCLAHSTASLAGSLTKADIERRFGPPLHVQEKLTEIPAWPLTSELEPEGGPVGYVFESVDLAPIPASRERR
jgi:NosR/NirI family nitrous oxide reductase transcriptional regulator